MQLTGGVPPVNDRPPSDEKRLRKDAVRSREKIVPAAMAAFAEHGLEVSIAEVAERAGVGVGTVYRRFGDKDSLIDTLFAAKIDEVIQLAESALAEDDPASAFLTFCLRCSELFADNKGLRQLMLSRQLPPTELTMSAAERLGPLREEITNRAKHAGWLRESFAPSDFPVILVAIQAVRDLGGTEHPDLWRRALRLCIDGARQDARTPSDLIVPPPLTREELQFVIDRRIRAAQADCPGSAE
ncbi:MAG: TetR/AcrR family transcriptional regulator [Nocardiaceae bacterium]|nr:TetR/AcrR family transcriptional regulator [Nocardiaceae bacterium]